MHIPKMLTVAAACAVVAGACAAKTAPARVPQAPKADKPQVELRCTPRMAMGAAFGPVTVMAFLSVKNPGEKFWCPAVEWHVNGEKSGGHESDCDPYAAVVAEQGTAPEVWSEPVKYFSFYEGEHTITAKLMMSGRLIASESCQVTAR